MVMFREFLVKNLNYKYILFLFVFCTFSAGFTTNSFSAEATNSEKNKNTYTKSDTITIDTKENYCEFKGNFWGKHKKTILVADKVRVYYYSESEKKKQTNKKEDSIKKIVAKGNVKITSEEKSAVTHLAVYTSIDGLLELTGPGTVVISGDSKLAGNRIIYNTVTGQMKAESGKSKRVEAILNSEDKDSLKF